ncbi:MAG TPA: His/Gly/Thr/Pro-type tRNA ligase C-terminal domain-containing protein, partial [Clostridia bacterium]|nr:His/Gly/Thr/Pro-type tRNA ligase C-terminal domain-containing protein [Clostridia bacterium]
AAVLPLTKKLQDKALEVHALASKCFMTDYDEAGAIGRRYRREDEIGTPFCITVDFDTLEDNTVTVRERDSMQQIRLKIEEAIEYVLERSRF